MSRFRLVRVGVALAVASVLSACGSLALDEDSGSASSGPGSADCIEEAQAAVDAASQPLKFEVPTESVDVSKAQGKTIWVIVTSMQSPLHEAVAEGIEAAAEEAGVNVHFYDGQFQPDRYNDGIRQAIAQGADGIVLQSVARELVSGPIGDAVKQGIPVVDLWNGGIDEPLDGFFAHVTSDFVQDGKVLADYVLAKSECKANAVTYTASQYVILLDMNKGIEDEFAALCPEDCKLKVSEVNTGELATAVGPQVVADLNRDRSINWLIPQFDAAAQPMVPAIKAAGLSDRVKLVGHDGVDVNMDWVRNQDVQVMDMSFPEPDYVGWVILDQMLRALSGAKPADLVMPGVVFDGDNIPAEGEPLFPEFGDYESAFEKLWGAA